MILSLLCLVCFGVNAQVEVVVSPTSGTFTSSNNERTWHGEWTSNVEPQLVLTVHQYSNNMTVADEKLELWCGSYNNNNCSYTLSVASGYVITGYSFKCVDKNATQNRFIKIEATGKTVNVKDNDTFEVTGLNSRCAGFNLIGFVEGDAKEKNNGIIVTDFRVTIVEATSVPKDTYIANNLVKVSDYPTNGEWAENTTWYFIQNKKGASVSLDNSNNSGYLTLNNNKKPAIDDEKAMWCIVGAEGCYRFYNKAAGTTMALTSTRALNTNSACFNMQNCSATAKQIFDLVASQQKGYVVIKDVNNENNYWNYRDANLAYWNDSGALNDDGSSFLFVDMNEVSAIVNETDKLLSEAEAKYSTIATPIDLTRNNYEMLYCNAPCTNTQYGDQFEGHWEYLFDGNYNTILHTEYGAGTSTDNLDHYIRVNMGDGNTIQKFQLTIGTRSKNCTVNSPTTIVVEGCNEENGTYEEISTVSNIPQTNSYDYTSPVLTNGKSYRYIRYRVTATGSNQKDGGGKTFFFIAEFGMSAVEEAFSISEDYAEYKEQFKAIIDAKNNVLNAPSIQALPAATTNLNNLYTTLHRMLCPNYYLLKDKVAELTDVILNNIGNAVGQYSNADAVEIYVNEANELLENSASTEKDFAEALEAFNGFELPSVNLPIDGKFYLIRSAVKENGYMYAALSDVNVGDKDETNKVCWATSTTPANVGIWKCEVIDGKIYFKNVHTASYFLNTKAYHPTVLSEKEKAVVTFTALGERQVNIKINEAQIHAQDNGYVVPWTGGKNTPSAWYIEEIASPVSHTVTIGPAGYATLMLGFDAKIPSIEGEENGVYTAVINGGWAVMTKVEDVLPANTAVIIKANPGDYEFVYTTETATITENDLKGTLYNKNIEEKAYVLGKDENDVAYLGVAKMTDGKFLNNANKAYLPAPAEASNVAYYGLRFDFGGTTTIEEVETENAETIIYDLTGRRVNEITKAGVYVVNGKKVLVK
ncbi:MAG: hypothetical protein J6Q48_07845 [Bacteroidaceae bacterium]|nr:hypothetical protein [Bacteroidaceae bacterium]